jgi:hypothetical protein
MSTRNISWEHNGGRYLGLTTLPPSYVDEIEIWEPQNPGALRAVQTCKGIVLSLPLPHDFIY